jgi:23S rRNA (guanosine2251-2'-O)-methyltransferase
MNFTKKAMHELDRDSVESFSQKSKTPIILIADNIRSAMNVGSLFRTADAFGIEGIYLCGYTPCPPQREILKTALGSTESVHWKYFEHIYEAIEACKESHTICALEQTHASTPLHEFIAQKPIALILGNEVHGVSDDALSLSNHALEITQFGTKHSLNVAVSAGIALFHISSQFHFKS